MEHEPLYWCLWIDWTQHRFCTRSREGFECVRFGSEQKRKENMMLLLRSGFIELAPE